MSLRNKLFFAFAAIVAMVVSVGVFSYRLNREIETRVEHLRSGSGGDLARIDVLQHGMEIEGFWEERGIFVAREVELLPGRRRPKLRGPVQQVDPGGGTVTLYGVEIAVAPETEFSEGSGETARLEDLHAGQRIEISARVEDGRWIARKIKTQNVKPSDQIKGTPTRVDLSRQGGMLEIHGLAILIAPPAQASPGNPLRDLRIATSMAVVLQDLRSLARELVGRTNKWDEAQPSFGLEPSDRALTARERLDEGRRAFVYYLDQLQPGPDDPVSAGLSQDPRPESLRQRFETLEDQLDSLEELSARDLDAAREYLDEVVDPHFERRLLPIVIALRGDAEESLSDEVRGISNRARATTRLAVLVSLAAVLAATVLGGLVWRSIDAPVRALHAAALRIGEGHLDTRVEVVAEDELGVLANAFNHMAEALTRTTVSVHTLESLFDSMAGILITLDPARQITNVNRGALELLGYSRDELVGRPFCLICAGSTDKAARAALCGAEQGIASVEELPLVRRDGSAVSVSFSSAALRAPDGPLQGYICVAQDLSEHKMIEEQVRSSLAEKELLLRELHHRVKNNMQVISSLLAIQASQSSDPQAAAQFEESQQRIRSMALIHEQLHHAADLARLDVAAYLESLVSRLIGSFGPLGSIEVDLDVHDLPMGIDQALVCGLIVNELVTNSLKHAFHSSPTGLIGIALWDEDKETRVLELWDDGPGLSDPAGTSERALGLALVTTLAKQLEGELIVVPGPGTRFRVEFPPDRSARGRSA